MKRILILRSKMNENDIKFIEMLNFYGKNEDISFVLSYYENLSITIEKKITISINGEDIFNFDLIYFKRWLENQFLTPAIAKYLKSINKKYIDSNISEINHGGKLIQLVNLSLLGLKVPKTVYLSKDLVPSYYNKLKETLGGLFVAKSIKGSKGDNNFLIKSESDFQLNVLENINKVKFIFQEYIPNDFDYRFLVLDGKVVSAEKRIRTTDGYLNNASKGAREEFFDPSLEPELSEIAKKAAASLGREVSGVDIVVSKENNEAFVLEVNPSPGFTYEYDAPEVEGLYKYLRSLV